MSLVLAFDTSAAHCAAALLCPGRPPILRVEEMARGQAERLVPLLDALLEEAGVAWRDLTVIGVGTGPGNFTGVRISVATARGMALGLGIPAIGVTTFEALAEGHPRPVTIRLPAPRGQVYCQDFDAQGPGQPGLEARTDGPGAATPPDAGALVLGIAQVAAARSAARSATDQPRPAPLYLRAADAAPSRDAAPRILPDSPP